MPVKRSTNPAPGVPAPHTPPADDAPTAAATPAETPPVSMDAESAARGLRDILVTLLPETGDRVRWHDVSGGAHAAPVVCSMRIQAQIAGLLTDSLPRLAGKISSDAAGLLRLATDPAVHAVLIQAFEILHPGAHARAIHNVANADPELRQAVLDQARVETPAALETADLFSAEDLVEAVLPFCVGPILKLLDRMTPVRH